MCGTIGAVYPGVFDPITYGHLDIIRRARRIFGSLLVGVAKQTPKSPLFSIEERVEMIKEALSEEGIDGVFVEDFDGLLVDFARSKGISVVVRSMRVISDFEYEFQLAIMNRELDSSIETVFLVPNTFYTYLSSSVVKEIARLGGDVSKLVPRCVRTRLIERLGGGQAVK
jgi:pantetheine-phosphate adenylyltransferase